MYRETWSGQIEYSKQFSAWQEYYEEAIYRTEYYTDTETRSSTDSKGRTTYYTVTVTKSRQVFDHWESETRWHNEYWKSYSNIDTTYNIDKSTFLQDCKDFGKVNIQRGTRYTLEHNSRMIGGDPNDYVTQNVNEYVKPVTKKVSFTNKIKASPSVFSFIKVDQNIPVFSWPENNDPFHSERLMGTTKNTIQLLPFDQMNARLGPTKLVNVIMIGFDNTSMLGQYQRAKFIGGKKNDLVLCYGGDNPSKATWSFVFGWTDSEIVKQNLQNILLNNPIDTKILKLIEDEINSNYIKKNWHDFDYLIVEVPTYYFWIYIVIVIVIQGGYWFYAYNNDCDKDFDEIRALRDNHMMEGYMKSLSKTYNKYLISVKSVYRDISEKLKRLYNY